MDVAKVGQVARRHKELAANRGPGTLLDTETARQQELSALNQLFSDIQRECDSYCASYNEAFGATRVRVDAHSDTVVIRSHANAEDTLVFHRLSPTQTHAGRIETRRYHYGEQPVHLPVDVRRTEDARLAVTLRGRDVQPAELVFDLLTTFTEHLARTAESHGRL
jgi:hypothetical protein